MQENRFKIMDNVPQNPNKRGPKQGPVAAPPSSPSLQAIADRVMATLRAEAGAKEVSSRLVSAVEGRT